jgi:hypothetical protein
MNLKQIYDKAVKIAEIATDQKYGADRIEIQEDGCIHAIWWDDYDHFICDEVTITPDELMQSMDAIEAKYNSIKERKRIEAEQRKQQQLEADKQREIEYYHKLKQKYEQQ